MNTSFVFLLLVSCSVAFALKLQKNEEISELFAAERDVKFYLFTRLNPTVRQELNINDINSIRNSNYDGNKPTRLIIHGWQSDSNTESVVHITNSFVRSADVNAILVDWGIGAGTVNLKHFVTE